MKDRGGTRPKLPRAMVRWRHEPGVRGIAAISRTLNKARARFEECFPESRPESSPGAAPPALGRYWATQLATATGQMAAAVALLPAAVGWMPSLVYSLCPFQVERRSSQ